MFSNVMSDTFEWNRAIIDVLGNTCAFPTVTSQNPSTVGKKKSIHSVALTLSCDLISLKNWKHLYEFFFSLVNSTLI